MIIQNLTRDSKKYTSNVYLIRGTNNAIQDVNTLIDVGRDPDVIQIIENASTGVGKKRIGQVIITHNHYDHTSLLPLVRTRFKPIVFAYSSSLDGVDNIVKDGDIITMGDRLFEAIHTPGHSSDSISLYCRDEGVLFTGDNQLLIYTKTGSYTEEFVTSLKRISRYNIKTIYPGHGKPIVESCNEMITKSLENVLNSTILVN
ncbi:MAG: MBL fold metallo-hydrolase [ANME-2 cluster archaeon]|nr:MBL fold metallo-hydrolase [ANME-2 cluster archaeon]